MFVIGRRNGTMNLQIIALTGRSGRALLNRGPTLFEPQMKFTAVSIVAFLGLLGMAQAQTPDHATSTLETHAVGTAMEARTINRTFLFDSRLQWHANALTRLVVGMEVDTIQRDDTEGLLASSVAATVWRIGPTGKRQPLWVAKVSGDNGAIDHDQPLFVVRQPGCCGARDSYTVFGLYNGRRLFTATGSRPSECWATLEVPNTGLIRLIAFHAAYSASDDAAFGARKETVGLLTYASPENPLARFRLVAKDAAAVDAFMGEATVRLVEQGKSEETDSLTLWSADGKVDPGAIGGFSIRLDLSEGNTVTIPVVADKLNLAAAVLPAGLKIEPAPLP